MKLYVWLLFSLMMLFVLFAFKHFGPNRSTSTPNPSAPDYDICVIGLGPAGLGVMFVAGQNGLSAVGIDRQDQTGGQFALYPKKIMREVLSADGVVAEEMIANLDRQARSHRQHRFVLGRTATDYKHHHNQWHITLDNKTVVSARALVFALGNGPIKPKMLSDDYANVYYSNTDQPVNKHVAILGGGDSALTLALQLAKTNTVRLIHRHDKFRTSSAKTADQVLTHPCITTHVQPNVESCFVVKNNQVTGVTIGGQTLAIDVVFCCYGLICDRSSLLLDVNKNNRLPFVTLTNLGPDAYATGVMLGYRPLNELWGNVFPLIRKIKQAIQRYN
jgi:thioredoxin reductase